MSIISQALKKAAESKREGTSRPAIPAWVAGTKRRSRKQIAAVLFAVLAAVTLAFLFVARFFSGASAGPSWESATVLEADQAPPEENYEPDTLHVSGIVSGYDGRHAVIGGRIVEEGDTFGVMRVIKIYQDRVVLKRGDEEFVITKDF